MDRLKLFLLGPPQIELGDRSLIFPRRKTLALLIYLAVTGTPQRRDTLATLLWPDSPQRQARASLSRDLSLLNSALGQDWLAADRETVSLIHQPDLWLDLTQFQQQVDQPQSHGHSLPEICAACLEALAAATTLYRDDFLSGFTLQDSPNFDDWQLFQAERLRRELVEALSHLVQGYAGQAEFKTALTYAQRWVSLDALHEPAQRCLMQLYAQAGDRTAALRQYQICSHLLEAELGLAPSPETVQLYEAIKSTQGSRGAEEQPKISQIYEWRQTLQGLSGESQNRHNLPAQLTPLLGREAELRNLSRLLAEPDLRLITLLGPGGIGKTHLALETARQQLERFPQGVYFVSLAPLGSPEAMIAATAKALGFSFYEGATPQQQLCDYLRQKRLLLVLDNFEHLLAPPSSPPQEEIEEGLPAGLELVIAWLQAAPALKILVTSRARLNLQGEQLFPLEGIDFPHNEEELQEISRYSAVQLFVQAARRLRPDFELTGAEARAVGHICRLVQGMPLGILLAAAWIDSFKPTEIASQIDQSLDFLAGEWRDLPARQQSLRAVFGHSWRLLSVREQAIFQQISVFRGGFGYEAAQAITGASLQELRALVHKSLLRRLETGRYEIHELLRQYGAEKLEAQTAEVSETSAVQAVHDRHSAYYCAFLEVQEADLKGARQQLAFVEIQTEHENIRLAWHWAAEQRQVERLAQAMDGLGLFYDWRGYFQEGEIAFQMAAEKLKPAIETLPILAKLLAWQALFCQTMGRTEQAQQLFRESLSYLNNPQLAGQNIHPEKAFVLFQMGNFMIGMDQQEAKWLLEQSLMLYQTLGDRWAIARGFTSLGNIALELIRYEEAQQRLQESLALQQELGDQRSVAQILTLLGYVARHQGRLEEAEQLQGQSLRLIEKMEDRAGVARIHVNLGASLVWLGRYNEGIRHFEECLAIYRDLGHPDGLGESNGYLADAKLHLGWYEQAQAHNQIALTLHRDGGNQTGIGAAFIQLSFLALAKEAYPEAQQWLHEAVVIFRKFEQQAAIGFVLAMLGGLACHTHNFQQAQEYFLEPLRIGLETKGFAILHIAPAFIALFLAKQDQPERAVEMYALASCYPYIGNSRWFEDVAGRHVAAAAAALPPAVVAAAQKRGRAREAWATAEALLDELRG